MTAIVVFVGFVLSGCIDAGQPDAGAPPAPGTSARSVVLREDLDAADFAKALQGQWISVFTHRSAANVQQAEFKPDGNATIAISRGGVQERIAGRYRLEFEREPTAGKVTFARIVVSCEGADVSLSRVNFGLHSGVHQDIGPLLRIDQEPYGALRRTSQHVRKRIQKAFGLSQEPQAKPMGDR